MLQRNHVNRLFGLILIAFCVYAGEFIWRTSFVIEGTRYFSLFDDEMISMRYARNLAEGNGLVWNPPRPGDDAGAYARNGKERVEGFTNPLWVGYMALWHLAPVPRHMICLFIQITGALLLLINLLFVKRIAEHVSGGSSLVTLGATALTAFSLTLDNWALQGTEVGLLALIVSAAIWMALRGLGEGRFRVGLYLLLGAGTLVRLDAAIPYLAILTFFAIMDTPRRRKHLLWGSLILIAFLGAQTAVRLWYYGDPLPNTYYLKMTGWPALFRITRGLSVLWQYLWAISPLAFGVAVAALFIRRDRRLHLLLWVFLGQVAYSIWVGGDAWEHWGGANRYLSIAFPSFLILFCVGFAELGARAMQFLRRHSSLNPRIGRLAIGAFLVFCVINLNKGTERAPLIEWLLLTPPLHVSDNSHCVQFALSLERVTKESASVAVTWAGAIPYFCERRSIDLLGKNDRQIARMPAIAPPEANRLVAFYPGHMKRDYAYSMGELKPDVISHIVFSPIKEAAPYLQGLYTGVPYYENWIAYFRKGSENVEWDRIRAISDIFMERDEKGEFRLKE